MTKWEKFKVKKAKRDKLEQDIKDFAAIIIVALLGMIEI